MRLSFASVGFNPLLPKNPATRLPAKSFRGLSLRPSCHHPCFSPQGKESWIPGGQHPENSVSKLPVSPAFLYPRLCVAPGGSAVLTAVTAGTGEQRSSSVDSRLLPLLLSWPVGASGHVSTAEVAVRIRNTGSLNLVGFFFFFF